MTMGVEPRIAGLAAPVAELPGEDGRGPGDGMALCLSGGGYRAMLFHLGAVWRLNELGYLPRLARVSSVSGGSITAGVLGWRWRWLTFDARGVATNLDGEVTARLRRLAGVRIDFESGLLGLLGPGSIADQLVEHYRAAVFSEGAESDRPPTLQDLPDGPPRFVISATNLQSGALWRFSKPYMGDHRVGLVARPTTELATAVAASSAFPPFLSPLELRVDPSTYFDGARPGGEPDLTDARFRSRPLLSDGGVYDNLGLETAYPRHRQLLVSDGGGRVGPDEEVARDWVRQMVRVADVIDNQMRSLRTRQLLASFGLGLRSGAYWSLRSEPADFPAPDPVTPPRQQILRARAVGTRLAVLDDLAQESLVNWGYAACDLGVRAHVDRSLPPPSRLPYPAP